MSIQVSTRIDHEAKIITTIPPLEHENSTEKMSRADVFGCMRGQFKMADDFDKPLEDFTVHKLQ